jgi:hypothetical protein
MSASLSSRLFERARDLARDLRDDTPGQGGEAQQAEDDARHVEQLVALVRNAVPHLPGVQRQQILRLLEEMGE